MRMDKLKFDGKGNISKDKLLYDRAYLSLRVGDYFIPEKYPGVQGLWVKELPAYARNEFGALVPMYADSLVAKVQVPVNYEHKFISTEPEKADESVSAVSSNSDSGK